MYYHCLLLALSCIVGASSEIGTLASGTPLHAFLPVNYSMNYDPSFHSNSKNIRLQKLNFERPKFRGNDRRNNQSIFSNRRESYMNSGAKQAFRQIWINNSHSIGDQLQKRRKVKKNSSFSAEIQKIPFQAPDNNSFESHITSLKSSKENKKTSVQTWNDTNASSPGGLMVREDLVKDDMCLTKNSLDSCLERATTPPVRGLPHTPAQLLRMCQLFKGGMKCVDDYTTRCLSPEKRALLEDNIFGAKSFLAFLCNDPRFQRDYLSHSLCMKAVSAHWDDCYLHFQYLLRLELRATADSDFDTMCCLRQKFLLCVDEAADIACNLDDALFLRKVTATLSYTEHRRLMCQREYTCSISLASKKRTTSQLGLAALLFFTLGLWSQKVLM